MQSDIPWSEVTDLFGKVPSMSIATVDEDGSPRVSPIGSVLFSGEGQGYYFEKYPKIMRSNLDRDPRMSILAVAPGFGYWVAALWRGRFKTQPAIRLVCEAEARRKATQEERNAWLAKVRPFRFFKGHDLLWKDMSDLREFKVIRVEPVELGRMNPSRSSMEIVSSIPALSKLVKDAEYFESKNFVGECSMNNFLVRMLSYKPSWLRMLYSIRGFVVKIMGVVDVVDHTNVEIEDIDFAIGGKVDFFTTVDYKADHYWIGKATDKHLTCHLCVVAEPLDSKEVKFHTFVIVNFLYWTGPIYFKLIGPFHHIVMHCMGKYGVKK